MKRRAKGLGSIRKRPDGLWQATLELEPVNGKRQRRDFYGKTQREALAKLKEAQAQLATQGTLHTGGKLKVGAFLELWLEDVARPGVRVRTLASYRQHVRDHIGPAIGNIELAKLSPMDVQGMLNRIGRKGYGQKALSPSTVQRIRATLRAALNQAMRWGHVQRNVATLAEPPKAEAPEITTLSREGAAAFLAAAREHRLGAAPVLALLTGMREGELFGLQWQDLDLDAGTLTVTKQVQRLNGEYKLVDLKTRASRRAIKLPPQAVEALRRHRVLQNKERLMAGGKWEDWGLVFCRPTGRPLDGSAARSMMKQILQWAELPPMRFHDLRHSAASIYLAMGVDSRVVMDMLGWSQITTAARYQHPSAELKEQAAQRMSEFFGESANG